MDKVVPSSNKRTFEEGRVRWILGLCLVLAGCAEPTEWNASGETASATVEVDTINTIDSGRKANRALRDAPVAKSVEISFVGIGKDRLGNETREPLYRLTFDGADVQQAYFDNLDPWDTLELAQAVHIESGTGLQVLMGSCDVQPTLCSLEPTMGE